MANTRLKEALGKRRLVCDGAMGTELMRAGLEQGGSGEMWNLTHPERVLEIQRRYVDAGADCIITNTFGGNRLMLTRHQHADELAEINRAAARVAREAFGGREGFVLGDIGPVGGVLEPYGDLKADVVRAALLEQAAALVAGGVDAIILETQTSYEELGLGIEAAKEAGAPCIIASLAYDRSLDGTFFKTMMGIAPEEAAAFAQEKGADVIALNCGTGMDMEAASQIIPLYKSVCDLFTMCQPNAGLPVLEKLKAVYKQTPEEMVQRLPDVLAAGANIVGSCCGSTSLHTRAIRAVVDDFNRTHGQK
ncbi:MAG TPA: homocysteine S-methyltransferase family protein [Verrucomicrobiae bacterium]|nr:homocysteine S-methyltransferase family protein [Verrucomicrobiae bacterium]